MMSGGVKLFFSSGWSQRAITEKNKGHLGHTLRVEARECMCQGLDANLMPCASDLKGFLLLISPTLV